LIDDRNKKRVPYCKMFSITTSKYPANYVLHSGVLPFAEQATSVRTALLATCVASKGLFWHFWQNCSKNSKQSRLNQCGLFGKQNSAKVPKNISWVLKLTIKILNFISGFLI
jgi:hypothetical protein